MSNRSIRRYRWLRLRPGDHQRWRTYLANQLRGIWAGDLFVLQTTSFRTLYIFFLIRHQRPELIDFNVTASPTAAWIWHQLLEAAPWNRQPKCGAPSYELMRRRVCEPAGMGDTEFLRSDELPGHAALAYLTADGSRTNVFHLPVRGSGDGGIYSTAADVSSLWSASFARRIVPRDWVAEMVRPRSEVPRESKRYGLGFWIMCRLTP